MFVTLENCNLITRLFLIKDTGSIWKSSNPQEIGAHVLLLGELNTDFSPKAITEETNA